MDARVAAPFLILAEASEPAGGNWSLTLANYGVAGIMLIWFMWKDKLDRDERKQAQADQERRHGDNIAQQKKIEDAFRTTTDSLIIGMSAMKTLDTSYLDLLSRMKASNGTDK